MYLPGEYRKSDVLCQGGEEQFDNSLLRGLTYIIGSGFMGSGFWVQRRRWPRASSHIEKKLVLYIDSIDPPAADPPIGGLKPLRAGINPAPTDEVLPEK
jgi:hypothetical protein